MAVIGKKASKVSKEEASDYIFGVTAGNDVSARNWQSMDLQWFRGKASDTFAPVGPVLVSGLNYKDLLCSVTFKWTSNAVTKNQRSHS